ncbi:hypothetical protein YQE_09949, partial [Dendroctonus ponderosae]
MDSWNSSMDVIMLTFCFVQFNTGLNLSNSGFFTFRKWGISEANNKYSYYLNFVKIVSNLTYKNLHLLNGFQNDETLINTDWIQLIEAVHPQLDGALLTFENKIKPEWQFYHIHSHLEIIHATSEIPTLVKQSEEYEVNYKLAETYSLNDIRYLTPQQRKCRFEDEPLTNNVPVYSNSICTMECRYRLAMEKCGCRPFFYPFLCKLSFALKFLC